MTDPVQVVAEARLAHEGYWYDPSGTSAWRCSCGGALQKPVNGRLNDHVRERHVNEAIVAALKAAGALMPDDAERRARNHLAMAEYESTYIVRLTGAEALLQEVREVLGLHQPQWNPLDDDLICRRCNDEWPCLEVSMLPKIDQAAHRPSPAPSSHGGAGVGEGGE